MPVEAQAQMGIREKAALEEQKDDMIACLVILMR